MGIKAWSDEEEVKLIEVYTNETQDVFVIAERFDKGHRSVISKLVNLGIYKKPEQLKKDSRTVKTMLRDIELMLDIDIDGLNLNKKSNLVLLVEALEKKFEFKEE